jgi:hypothetical protein
MNWELGLLRGKTGYDIIFSELEIGLPIILFTSV